MHGDRQPGAGRVQTLGDRIDAEAAIVDDASTVTFERLLLNRADNKRITLASRSALPLAWKVRPDDLAAVEGEGGADGKPDFSIAPTSG